jgi:hypothetical protein
MLRKWSILFLQELSVEHQLLFIQVIFYRTHGIQYKYRATQLFYPCITHYQIIDVKYDI